MLITERSPGGGHLLRMGEGMDELLRDGPRVGGCRVKPGSRAWATVGDIGVPRLVSWLARASDFSELTEAGGRLAGNCGKRGSPRLSPERGPTELHFPLPCRSADPVWPDPPVFQEKLEI